ncbi:MAG: hypothetical protein ACP6IS_06070 [Candidatus Asgardarchaeia archaeon]
MPIVGLFFDKLEAERNLGINEVPPPIKGIQYNNRIKNVEEIKISQMNIQVSVFSISFEFSVVYTPPIASIRLEGKILYLPTNEHEKREIYNIWHKQRKLPENVAKQIVGATITRGIQKATVLSDHIGVPPPVPPPPIGPKGRRKEDIGKPHDMYV